MPYLKNTLGHGVRSGATRIPPGGVADVDGDAAKVLGSYAGVEKASKEEYDAAHAPDATGGGSPSRDAEQRMKAHRVAHRVEATAAPLQVVVGDDDAPYGPPSGVVTTKQTEAKKGAEEKRRFADHEHAEVPKGASKVEQKQAKATAAVEEVASKLAAEQSSDKK